MKNDAQNLLQVENFSLSLIIGLFGFGCACLWLLSFFFGTVTSFDFVSNDFGLPLRLCLLVLCALVMVLHMVWANAFKGDESFKMASVAMVIVLILFEISIKTVAVVVLTALLMSMLLVFWNSFLCNFSRIVVYLGFITAVCAACLALMVFIDSTALFVVIQTLPAISVLCTVLIVRTAPIDTKFVSKKESDERNPFKMSSIAVIVSDGVITGLVFFFVSFFDSGLPQFRVLVCAAAIFIITAVFTVGPLSRVFLERNMLRSYAVRFAPFLLLLPFSRGALLEVCLVAMLISCTLNIIMVISATTEQVRFNQLSMSYTFGRILALLFGGLALGWVLGLVAFRFQFSTYALAAVCYSLLFVLIFFNAFVFRDNYPLEEQARFDDAVPGEYEDFSRPWAIAIEKTAERYSLSPRQREVFELLARGRNCDYIKDQFCISKSTAKAHIYSIYRKLDVHSQQELINCVEEIQKANRSASYTVVPTYDENKSQTLWAESLNTVSNSFRQP